MFRNPVVHRSTGPQVPTSRSLQVHMSVGLHGHRSPYAPGTETEADMPKGVMKGLKKMHY